MNTLAKVFHFLENSSDIVKCTRLNINIMKARILILIVTAILVVVSCNDDFLEEQTFSQITPELVFTNAANAQLAVNALYTEFFHNFSDMRGFWPAGWMGRNQEFSSYNQNAANDLQYNSGWTQLYWMWRGLYRGVNACNTAIVGIGDMEAGDAISEEEKTQLIAESRFLRAHGYYYLLRLFGGVPLHTEPTENPENATKGRSSAQTIFEFIVEDLKFAQQHLPINWSGGFPDNGRCTKGAATATLAQVYACVSGAQFEGNDAPQGESGDFNNISQKYWNEARTELASMIDESNPSQAKAPYMYALEADLASLYAGGQQVSGAWSPIRPANDLGSEVIWAANYEPSIYQGTWLFNHWPNRFISPYVQERFESDGYRARIKIDSVHRAAQDRLVCKHIKRNWAGNNNENNIYWARYGGILLLMAHVENEVNGGPTQLAEDCLNAVRARARNGDGVNTFTVPLDVASGLSYNDFKDEVFDERVAELFVEFKFWSDLQMSGRLERDWAILASGDTGDRGTYRKQWKFLPIPQREIDVSGGLISQNAGH